MVDVQVRARSSDEEKKKNFRDNQNSALIFKILSRTPFHTWFVVVLVAKSWLLTPCNPMDCSLPGSSVHRLFQARILAWVSLLSPGGLPDLGIKPLFPALAGGFFTTEPLGKYMNTIPKLFM